MSMAHEYDSWTTAEGSGATDQGQRTTAQGKSYYRGYTDIWTLPKNK